MNHFPNFTSEFSKYGFHYGNIGESDSISYFGSIDTSNHGEVNIEFRFLNSFLTEFPKAYICEDSRDEFEPYHFPHLDGKWELCYEDGSRVFNPYQYASMVEFAIQETKNLIENVKLDDMEEIAGEFLSYWKISSGGEYFYGMIDSSVKEAYLADKWIFDIRNRLKLPIDKQYYIPIYDITSLPSLKNIEWPITTVNDFFKWLDSYSEVSKEITSNLKRRIGEYKSDTRIILRIKDMSTYLSVVFHFSNPLLNNPKRQILKDYTINSIFSGKHKIERGWIENHSPEELICSNVTEKTPNLINKKILLIGAGTIGSHLADLLVKNGAGIGSIAKFVIVDPDIYSPYNLSRHYLGLSSTARYKATELVNKIAQEVPFVCIEGITQEVQKVEIEDYDLIIDSTGEESLTTWINEKLLSMQTRPHFLSTWIKGSGEAVECLYIPSDFETGCHECYRRSDFVINLNKDVLPLRDSCRSVFIPFPISASLYASLLTVEVIISWLRHELPDTYIFQQRISPIEGIEKHKILKSEECPICGSSYMKE